MIFLITIFIILVALPFIGIAFIVDSAWPIYLGIILGFVVLVVWSQKAQKKEDEKKAMQIADEKRLAELTQAHENGLKIYKKLFEEFKISDVNSQENEQALLLVSNSYVPNVDIKQAKELFLIGKEEYAFKKEKARMTIRNSELEKFKKQKEEADRIGKDKYTYMAEYHKALDIVNNALRAAKEEGARKALYTTPRKQDWAMWGGVASALGGTAAGFAIASDIQTQNEKAEREAMNARREAQASLDYYKNNPVEKQYSSSESAMQEYVESRLFNDSNINEWFSTLNFENITLDITEGLNFIIQGTIDCPSSFEMLGRLSVLDGAVKILIKDQSQKVVATGYFAAPGSANMRLSEVGFYPGIVFQSICKTENMHDIANTLNYTYEFQPYHLWLIEV